MSLKMWKAADLRQMLPLKWRQQLGVDIYKRYIELRLRLLGAEVLTHGTEHKIEYTRIEQGKPEKLIFLPGFADSKENFYDAAQCLRADFDILIVDLPGFGHSFKRKGEHYNLQNYGQWMQTFIEELGWTDFHLMGNSLGGAVAIELALRMPERLKSLTLLDPAGVVLPELPSIYHEFVEGRNVFEIHTPMQFNYFLNRVFYKPPMIPPFVWDHLYKEFSRHSKWHSKVLNDLLEGIRTMDDPRLPKAVLNERLKNIQTPTLILWGDEDSFFPASTGYYMQSQMPDSVFYLLANRGHGPQIEAPWQISKLFRKFVNDLRSRKEAEAS